MSKEGITGLAYGKGRLTLHLDPTLAEWHVIQPKYEKPLDNPKQAFQNACRNPLGSRPLRDIVNPSDRVVIVTSDGTRPVPNRLLLPWLLEEMRVPFENITILLGTGTHRANTEDETSEMLGPDLCRQVNVVHHDAFDPQKNVVAGKTADGVPVILDKAYVQADKRIVVGFIEPHFFAGFSGGPKGVVPGAAGIETIFHVHGYDLIAHPNSTWGVLDDNPLHETISDMVAICPPDFLVNVSLNNDKAIAGLFAGHYREAHRAGCARVRENAMVAVPHSFPIVVTSNSGYPLDQNLYQTVKGMSAAAKITSDNGMVFVASECSDGIPSHGNFGSILQSHSTVESVEVWLKNLANPVLDQWQVQVLVQILARCRVSLHSRLDPECVKGCKLSPVDDLKQSLRNHIEAIGKGVPVAVLPEGPITVPYFG